MPYQSYNVKLLANQKANLSRAFKSRLPVTIRLSYNDLVGNDTLHLTKRQIKKIEKSKRNGVGCDIKISRTQIRKVVGGSLLSTILSIGSKILPYVTKVIKPLASGAMFSTGTNVVDKAFGKGIQSGGYLVPPNKFNQRFPHTNFLTASQKRLLINSMKTGKDFFIKPTRAQSGGFLGTLLASIGIPMLLNALTGKGLQNRPHYGSALQNRPVYRRSGVSIYTDLVNSMAGSGKKKFGERKEKA